MFGPNEFDGDDGLDPDDIQGLEFGVQEEGFDILKVMALTKYLKTLGELPRETVDMEKRIDKAEKWAMDTIENEIGNN